jgi:hypothetical protein
MSAIRDSVEARSLLTLHYGLNTDNCPGLRQAIIADL